MTAHTDTRLQTQDGTVVAYLAPTIEVNPTFDNDVNTNPLPDSQGSIARDLGLFVHEITFQGTFERSDNLPDAHQNDLESLFPSAPVTPRMQANRIIDFAYRQQGPFELYNGSDEYTATSVSEIDVPNGVYPTVQISQVRPTKSGGEPRRGFTLKFAIGFENL